MANEPDRIYIDKNDKAIYERIEKANIFNDKGNKDLFIYAMIIGFEQRLKEAVSSKLGFVRVDYFNDEDMALINSLAIIESKDIDMISERKTVYQLAEEYAHAGLKILNDKLEKVPYEVFESNLELEIITKYEAFLKASSKSKG